MTQSKPDRLPMDLHRYLLETTRIAVLTGAGVSAESGIPTFREAQTGLWSQYDPMTLASPEGFAQQPDLVWRWYQWRRELVAKAAPNAGHKALASIQQHLPEFTLITQNVDGLHQQAGSSDVLELHGNIHRTVCSRTGSAIEASWLSAHAASEPPPSPHHADGLARPDVVWFGEALDECTLQQSFDAAQDCELMIVAGTAGVVHPAASLTVMAQQAGARVVDINPEHNEISRMANWYLQGTSARWLPVLAATLEKENR